MARKWQVRRKFLHQQTGLRDLSFLVPTDPRELAEFVGRLFEWMSLRMSPEEIAHVLEVDPKDIEAVEVPDATD